MDKCHHGRLVIFPDYSSTGVWCDQCGIGFVRPGETFPSVPSGLFDIADVWNAYWDRVSSSGVGDTDFIQELINSSG